MPADEPIRISWTINFSDDGGVFEIPRAEWAAMTPDERSEAIQAMYDVEMANNNYGGWDVRNANLDDPTGA